MGGGYDTESIDRVRVLAHFQQQSAIVTRRQPISSAVGGSHAQTFLRDSCRIPYPRAVCLRWWDPVFQVELFGHAIREYLSFAWKRHDRQPRSDSDNFGIEQFRILQRRAQI